jgi:Flp pilus assembly protein TadB
VAVHDDPVLVTTAARSPAEERRDRERRYLITMGVRVVAFIVAILVARGWVRVIAIALALVLPWVAVVAANSPARSRGETPSLYRRRPHREITDREETGD